MTIQDWVARARKLFLEAQRKFLFRHENGNGHTVVQEEWRHIISQHNNDVNNWLLRKYINGY
jgi:hypothetical protein